jgi:predicted homoserine dehydrogenase-like protein
LELSEEDRLAFTPLERTAVDAPIQRRVRKLGRLSGAKPWDLVELAIVANATDLSPDLPKTHCPPLWTTEIPIALAPRELGGLLSGGGGRVLDAVQVIRQKHEASLGGGVFLVVRAQEHSLRQMIGQKAIIAHPDGSTALILRPHHLLGVEAMTSILAAALLKIPTSAIDYRPRYDVVYRSAQPMKAGERIGGDHSAAITAELVPAVRSAPASPLPAGLLRRCRLRCDVEAGVLLSGAMVEPPAQSALWDLRREQESHWETASAVDSGSSTHRGQIA